MRRLAIQNRSFSQRCSAIFSYYFCLLLTTPVALTGYAFSFIYLIGYLAVGIPMALAVGISFGFGYVAFKSAELAREEIHNPSLLSIVTVPLLLVTMLVSGVIAGVGGLWSYIEMGPIYYAYNLFAPLLGLILSIPAHLLRYLLPEDRQFMLADAPHSEFGLPVTLLSTESNGIWDAFIWLGPYVRIDMSPPDYGFSQIFDMWRDGLRWSNIFRNGESPEVQSVERWRRIDERYAPLLDPPRVVNSYNRDYSPLNSRRDSHQQMVDIVFNQLYIEGLGHPQRAGPEYVLRHDPFDIAGEGHPQRAGPNYAAQRDAILNIINDSRKTPAALPVTLLSKQEIKAIQQRISQNNTPQAQQLKQAFANYQELTNESVCSISMTDMHELEGERPITIICHNDNGSVSEKTMAYESFLDCLNRDVNEHRTPQDPLSRQPYLRSQLNGQPHADRSGNLIPITNSYSFRWGHTKELARKHNELREKIRQLQADLDQVAGATAGNDAGSWGDAPVNDYARSGFFTPSASRPAAGINNSYGVGMSPGYQ